MTSESTSPTDTAGCSTVAPAPACSAFRGMRRVASGTYPEVARCLAGLPASDDALLVFDDDTGAQVDHPWPDGFGAAPPAEPEVPAACGVGRPRLGVVAREVTLLPRHWAWLSQQRGGASAALRRLVDEARQVHAQADLRRQAQERAYRFMSAIAANLPDFEEASRALFAGDGQALARRTEAWPADVRNHLAWLARDICTAGAGKNTPAAGAGDPA
ncbi:MAG: DUF2239 family protein [Burkholderiaceae bacterium]